jgi:hypothetical protein
MGLLVLPLFAFLDVFHLSLVMVLNELLSSSHPLHGQAGPHISFFISHGSHLVLLLPHPLIIILHSLFILSLKMGLCFVCVNFDDADNEAKPRDELDLKKIE